MSHPFTFKRARVFAAAVSLALISAVLPTATVGAQTVMCDGRVATIVGTPGDDTLNGTREADVIAGLQGNDVIFGNDGDDIICGGKGDDRLRGGEGFDIIFGAQGDDEIYANFGDSGTNREDIKGARMFGGAGNDEIHGSNKWDRMQGGPGIDVLWGYEGRDWIRGGADRDEVYGGVGIDDVHGGNGSDRIGVRGADIVKGGAGNDMCVLASEPEQLRSCGRNRPEPTPRDGQIRYSAGAYLTPREVPVGLYRTTNYWEINDANDRTITNDFQFDEPTVAIVDERAVNVEFRRAAQKVDAKTPRINPFAFERGRFIVGLDIAPGTYRVNQTGEFNAQISTYDLRGRIIDIELAPGSVLLVVGTEAAFFDFSNGTLERVTN